MNVSTIARRLGHTRNGNNLPHCNGKAFTTEKWLEIMEVYDGELRTNNGICTPKNLSKLCDVSVASANKAITFYVNKKVTLKKKGHGRNGIGSLKGLTMQHHKFLYDLYTNNRRLPTEAYIFEFNEAFGIKLSVSFITRWLHGVDPCDGTPRLASSFPSAKYSAKNTELLRAYFAFVRHLDDHRRLVFVGKKTMKGSVSLSDTTRCDPLTGDIIPIRCSGNNKVRYNILAAVTVKRNLKRNIDFLVMEDTIDSFIFGEFVAHLIRGGVLVRGDIFVVNNSSIYMKGENEFLQEALLQEMGILMVSLPPYYNAELNPTAHVFNHLMQVLKSESTKYGVTDDSNCFKTNICNAVDYIPFSLVVKGYLKSGYLK